MSRGGRGGGRGGRGGARGGGRPNVPWDTGEEIDGRPSELFPPRLIPTARRPSVKESAAVRHMLLLRHQLHSSPLYTSKRTSLHDPTAPRKLYGQSQVNDHYGVKNKASLDPFTAMPTYSQKFVREERALPDWSGWPVCRDLFPPELRDTVEPEDGFGVRKKRRLELNKVSALPNAEAAFGMPSLDGGAGDDFDNNLEWDATPRAAGGRNILDKLDAMRDEEREEGAEVDEEEIPEEEEDEAYDDEDAGDYDAENYFDNGDDMGDDYGDGGDEGEGTY